jgi:predicted ribonuclease toxin of YeeF-YezG toxin-antitoxin module
LLLAEPEELADSIPAQGKVVPQDQPDAVEGNGQQRVSSGILVPDQDAPKLGAEPEYTELAYGEHIQRGAHNAKQLVPNSKYTTPEGYTYCVDVDNLESGTAKRNPYAQRTVGGSDRLETDDGGHLIGSKFRGSGDIDNLVPQAATLNRAGGKWYKMESEWGSVLADGGSVTNIKIDVITQHGSTRPSSFNVSYSIRTRSHRRLSKVCKWEM